MHTAVRLGSAVARRIRAQNPCAHLCLFGLYAALNAEHLLAEGIADSVIGGEFEAALVDLARALAAGTPAGEVSGITTRDGLARRSAASASLAPRQVGQPSGAGCAAGVALPAVRGRAAPRPPPGARSVWLHLVGPAEGETRVVGYLEASRGCLHRCLHCPITPVYDGRFLRRRARRSSAGPTPRQQIAAGARGTSRSATPTS